MKSNLKRIAESSMLLAIGTVLSLPFFTFKGPWALGGGITVCSMLPLVMLAWRYGTKWGVFSALVYSLLQLVLGLNNLQYMPNAASIAAVILLDYIAAFGVIGFSAVFAHRCKNARTALILGIIVTFLGRFACHFISGLVIWEALWPNELGWAPAIWSLAYNSSYMLPELLITSIVAYFSYAPLERFWQLQDPVRT